jgi:beta-glucanase (GH16 family)
MKRNPMIIALLILGAASLQACVENNPLPPDPRDGDWRLVWSDEFDNDGLPDSRKWSYDVGGHGWGNNELQHYTDARLENARVEGGRLIIEARREAMAGKEYTSARLVTRERGDWLYGRVEVRAKLPSGRGTWPAIWMLPTEWRYGGWPASGEIDIMEHVGHRPDVVHATVHTDAYNHVRRTEVGAEIVVSDARSAFNTYSIEWSPEEIKASVNGQHYFTFENERLTNDDANFRQWPFDQPFHLILNIAVGGDWGGAQGVDPAIWPQRMEIEYVRVYQR